MKKSERADSDAALVTQVRAGNREAFDALASRYYASLLRLCVRLINDPVGAQDIAQEATLQAFLGLNRLRQPARFGAWLHAIAANLARSSLRRLRPISFDEMESTGRSNLRRAVSFPSSEQIAALRETHEAILAALKELSTVNREAVVGYYLEGYTYAELANILGVPISTVKSRLFKGRRQMRKQLEDLQPPVLTPPAEIRKEFPMTTELIHLQIEMICEYPLSQRSIVVLRALTDERYLPIKLSPDEAIAIERELKKQSNALPITPQDTLLQLMNRLGGRIETIIIRSLLEQNYYASLILAQDGKLLEVDCRLSDALLLSVRAKLPIQISPALLHGAGVNLESLEIDPTLATVPFPKTSEPVSASEQWPQTFVEQVWSFLLSVLYKDRTPHDLSRLRNLDWNQLFSSTEFHWEDETMQAVRLPASEPAWLVVRPQLWRQILSFVERIQHRDMQHPADPRPLFVPLNEDRQEQIEAVLKGAWPGLINLGVRTLALMHLSGQLACWRSLDDYESAVLMGRAAVRDLVLTRHLNALVHAAAEPGIRFTYERNPSFNPAQAAGTNVVSSSETLIGDAWLLVIGWASDRQGAEEQPLLAQIQADLEALLSE